MDKSDTGLEKQIIVEGVIEVARPDIELGTAEVRIDTNRARRRGAEKNVTVGHCASAAVCTQILFS